MVGFRLVFLALTIPPEKAAGLLWAPLRYGFSVCLRQDGKSYPVAALSQALKNVIVPDTFMFCKNGKHDKIVTYIVVSLLTEIILPAFIAQNLPIFHLN